MPLSVWTGLTTTLTQETHMIQVIIVTLIVGTLWTIAIRALDKARSGWKTKEYPPYVEKPINVTPYVDDDGMTQRDYQHITWLNNPDNDHKEDPFV